VFASTGVLCSIHFHLTTCIRPRTIETSPLPDQASVKFQSHWPIAQCFTEKPILSLFAASMLPRCVLVAFGNSSLTFLPTIHNNVKKLLILGMVENVNVGNVLQGELMIQRHRRGLLFIL
jgi:hypothetical protein